MEATTDTTTPRTFKGHPVFVLDDVPFGAHDALFTAWRNLDTGEQVTDWATSDRLDAALMVQLVKQAD